MRRSLVRRTSLALAALSALTLVACGGNDEAMSPPGPFVSQDGRFSAMFPTTPEREEQDFTVDENALKFVLYLGQLKEEAAAVGWVDFPPELTDNVEQRLEAAVQGAANNLGGTVERSQPLTFLDRPARDGVINSPQADVYTRVFFDGVRMYMLQGLAAKDSPRPASYDRLLSSFALL
jgi:hypothetical protein